ncbi:hypothetical protein H4S08_003910 [Coemansia sp. RSA 1365]|nr:hypothetical protein H4S08_003910 [Coemansia sp. RSA 1365]
MTAIRDSRQDKEQAEESESGDINVCAGDESIVTACGYLTAQADLEREAAEVLSGRFDECTYDKGYIHQPLYACLTCTKPPTEYARDAVAGSGDQTTDPAGMCYSCSIECHSGHEVIELFTKRHFRCDCGTRRLLPYAAGKGSGCCRLKKTRAGLADLENRDNAYSHNFWGFYCRCDKFYDPSIEADLMVQCYICNDWYHDACIGMMPDENRYDDYICRECVSKHAVVRHIRSNKMTKGLVSDNLVTQEAVVEPEEDETRSESLYDSALKQLRTMDHTRAMNAATAYSSLSSRLKTYLQPFAASGKIVTDQDIHAFFEQQKLHCNDAEF